MSEPLQDLAQSSIEKYISEYENLDSDYHLKGEVIAYNLAKKVLSLTERVESLERDVTNLLTTVSDLTHTPDPRSQI